MKRSRLTSSVPGVFVFGFLKEKNLVSRLFRFCGWLVCFFGQKHWKQRRTAVSSEDRDGIFCAMPNLSACPFGSQTLLMNFLLVYCFFFSLSLSPNADERNPGDLPGEHGVQD